MLKPVTGQIEMGSLALTWVVISNNSSPHFFRNAFAFGFFDGLLVLVRNVGDRGDVSPHIRSRLILRIVDHRSAENEKRQELTLLIGVMS